MGKRDLITKDFALYVVHYFASMQTWSKKDILAEIDRTIKEAKPEDAVRTVKCEGCEYWIPEDPERCKALKARPYGACNIHPERTDWQDIRYFDEFCSRGKRKEDERSEESLRD